MKAKQSRYVCSGALRRLPVDPGGFEKLGVFLLPLQTEPVSGVKIRHLSPSASG